MDFNSMTREQLREVARKENLNGYGKMGAGALRAWLIDQLRMKETSRKKKAPLVDPLADLDSIDVRRPFSGDFCIRALNRAIKLANESGMKLQGQ